METKRNVEDILLKMIKTNESAIKRNEKCNSNCHLIGNEIEEKLINFCKNNKISLKIIDVLQEYENQKTKLEDLYNELEKSKGILYLKNYIKASPKLRYRFSSIYKEQICCNKYGKIEKENLQYLGTVIITSFNEKENVFKLDDSENSCFGHFKI